MDGQALNYMDNDFILVKYNDPNWEFLVETHTTLTSLDNTIKVILFS